MRKTTVLFLLFSLFVYFVMLSGTAMAEENILKEYDEAGNCILQMYLDENAQPKLHNNSYYGLSRVYGEYGCISITYLDADQKPMVNKSGYARVERELDEEGHVIREMYYGVDGEPTEIKHGQYGTQKVYENGKVKQRIPLGRNGQPVFLLYRSLYGNQWLVILGAIFVMGICAFLPLRWKYGLLILYIIFILYMTLYVREFKEDPKYSFDLFWSFRKAIKSTRGIAAWEQIIDNILLFVPLAFVLKWVQIYSKVWHVVLECVAFSILIEGIQYLTGLGFMEIDDVIWNGTGAIIGAAIAAIGKKMKETGHRK